MLESLFEPRSVLLTGVSNEPGNLAFASLHNLITFRFAGEIHLLGRTPGEILGRPVRTSFDEIPNGIDVAVILTPARTVAAMLEQCGQKGIRYAIVQSAGFKELGPDGEALAVEILAVARRHGIRFTGPNGLGVMHPAVGFMPVFVPLRPQWKPGGVSIASQSGGMGFTYLWCLADQNVGVAKVVSMGNKLDLDEVDYVRHFAGDQETKGIVLYLEGLSRGRELFDVLRACPKPVVVHKAGRTEAGTKMAFSHTAALAANDAVLDAMLRQAGAFRVHSQQEVVNACKAMILRPVRGNRVAIVSRSGGHAVVAADCAAECGFELPPYPPELLPKGREVIKRGNPMDLGDVFDCDVYANLLERLAASQTFDAVVLLFGYFPPFETAQSHRFLHRIHELNEKYGRPIVVTLLSDEVELTAVRREIPYPTFPSVEDVFGALKLARDYQIRVEHQNPPTRRECATPASRRSPMKRLGTGSEVPKQPTVVEAFQALVAAEIPVAPFVLALNEGDLAQAPAFPVAAKVASAKAIHKSDRNGVVLGIRDAAELAVAFRDLARRFGPFAEGEGVLVQAMAAQGLEAVVGGTRDPVFGPVVMVGLGGVLVEVVPDVQFRLAPVALDEARKAIRCLRGAGIMNSIRGRPASDVDALAGVVVAVSDLLVGDPEIQEIDLNPVIVHPVGCTAVDVRIRLAATPAVPAPAALDHPVAAG